MSDKLEYLDFEVNIDRADENNYIVRVNSLGGRAEVRFADPFTADKRTIIRQTLTSAALRSSARVRSSSAGEIATMKELGYTLFDQAFRDQVREFYYQCLGQANQQAKGLRVRLALDPSLNDLPWEFLATAQKEFLGLDPKTPIVRYVELPTAPVPLKAELPLRVLVVIASPRDQIPLDTDAEKNRISAALAQLEEQGLVRVSYIEGQDTWPRLIDALRPNETHILHFIGHGAFDDSHNEGVLLMEGEDGSTKAVGSELMRILLQGKTRLRLAILNSCLGAQAAEAEPLSSVAVGMVQAGVPAVIAMQFEVSDRAAQIIAGTFYKSLTLNFPVDAALTEARRQIALLERDSLEWATPVLFMQVPDGQLFDIAPMPTPQGATKEIKPADQPGTAKPGASAPTPSTPTSAAKPPTDLNARAAERYQAAEEAEARGDWEVAATGYRGALLLVPGYRDAAQRQAYCERRAQCVKLYKRAQDLYQDKQYTQVLDTLSQIRAIDPRWVDSADLQTLSDCGVTYQRSITLLQQGDKDRGADLLREVITKCPDFEDVLQRLDNLAAGGDGLFGMSSPQRSQVVESSSTISSEPVLQDSTTIVTSSSEPNTRVYKVSGADLNKLAAEIRQYFITNGFENQIVHQGSTIVVQGKKGGLRSIVGMGQAATVMLHMTDNGIKASVGGGKWLEQGAAIAVSMFVLWPLLITGGIGMAQQKGLIDTLWRTVENHVTSRGGQRIG